MKTKLDMAHEYLLRFSGTTVADAWAYADAMQAEANKREPSGFPNVLRGACGEIVAVKVDDKEWQPDWSQAQRDAELYGTGFLKVTYDSDGVKYERLDPKTISVCSSNIGLDSQVLKEWQPDWSQAPEWANWWAMDENRDCYWHSCVDSPFIGNGVFEVGDSKGHTYDAPSFGYHSNWRNSLRKRPK